MDASKNLKNTHPQKYYMKTICNFIFYLGLGHCWYEMREWSLLQRNLYLVWAAVSNSYALLFIINEFLANLRSDLNEKEKNDLLQFNFAHFTIIGKVLALYLQKERIKVVMKRLLDGTRTIFVSEDMDMASVKHFVRYGITVLGISYAALFTSTIDGIRAHFKEDIPIRTEVTFYPNPADSGIFVNICRFFVEFHWWFIVAMMVCIDCLTIGCLVFVGFKFKAVQVYFQNLRNIFLNNTKGKSQTALEDEFKRNFVIGIKLHEDALWCAKNVQYALGNIYSVQVFECVTLLVMCLIKLVTVERNLIFLLAISVYISCLVMQTGSYMIAAGDITHEASLVSIAIYHCGWELTEARTDVRVLVVVALQRSQVPVHMTAFGVIELSYNNFVSVLRSSYSFFAVTY